MTDAAPICHTYDRTTGLYLGAVTADPSPAEPGVWLYPAFATLVPPPVSGPQQAAVWSGEAWTLVPDHRGETRWLDHATSYVVETLGEPEGSIEQPPAPPQPIVVPASVTNFQARAALIAAGLFDQVDAAVHASGDQLAIQAWEYANNVYRQSSLIAQLGAALGLTEQQIDALFITAAAIDA